MHEWKYICPLKTIGEVYTQEKRGDENENKINALKTNEEFPPALRPLKRGCTGSPVDCSCEQKSSNARNPDRHQGKML
jgi:biotin synthase-related radical SAM superfamily protein